MYPILKLIRILYPRPGPYSLVFHRNHRCRRVTSHKFEPCILPHNIFLIVIFINEYQQLRGERREIVRRILYLNTDVAKSEAGNSYLQRTCSEGLVLEFNLVNLLSFSLERQDDQWGEQDHRCSGEYS